jgi:hypothetical protein
VAGEHACIPFAQVSRDERKFVPFPDPVEVLRKLRVYNAYCANEEKRRLQAEKFRFG